MREPRIKREYGGYGWSVPVFECEWCGGDTVEWVEYGDEFICPKCAFINGIISDQEYIKLDIPDYFQEGTRAIVLDGEILVAYKGEKFPFEKTNRDYRKSKEYTEWRSKVFERDNFTCQVCGKVGGTLNAHHIKPFKDYPQLRFKVSNGITLCQECHRELHKRLRNAGKKNVHEENNGE